MPTATKEMVHNGKKGKGVTAKAIVSMKAFADDRDFVQILLNLNPDYRNSAQVIRALIDRAYPPEVRAQLQETMGRLLPPLPPTDPK